MLKHRRKSKLCLLGLGSGGFCLAVSLCVAFVVVATVVICCVDCWMIVDCWLLQSFLFCCELSHVVVLEWRLLLYCIGDCCWLLNWLELKLILKLNWNWYWKWFVLHRRQSKLCLLGLGRGWFCISDQCVVVTVVICDAIVCCWLLWIVGECLSQLHVVPCCCWLLISIVIVLDWRLLLIFELAWSWNWYWNWIENNLSHTDVKASYAC